jgi:uncharacterized protein YggT (Ycf19 family)
LQKKPKAMDKLQSYYHQVLSWLPSVYKKPLPTLTVKMAGADLSACIWVMINILVGQQRNNGWTQAHLRH